MNRQTREDRWNSGRRETREHQIDPDPECGEHCTKEKQANRCRL
jgi:hypothetical protein